MGFVTIIKALFTRILFACHSFITVWRVVGLLNSPYYWGLLGGLFLLILESLYTLIKRKGVEYKWVCPAFFFYLCSSVPGIWFLELDRLDRYQKEVNNMTRPTSPPKEGENGTITTVPPVGQNVGLANINGATIPIAFSPDMWVLVIEQSLMFLLVIGRWLLPKGEITRDQLSQLLFVYIGLASDIMELFVLFDEKDVLLHPFLLYIILGIWTMSLIQFALVLTATKARRKKVALIKPDTGEDDDCAGCCGGKCCESEIWSILITVFLQDAPFLSIRAYVMVTFKLFNYTILFFTVKNALVIVLQFYRLIVVSCLNEEEEEDDEETGKGGFDNKALTGDDGAVVIGEKPWKREPPPSGDLKRRSPVGAVAGVTGNHHSNEATAWGERFRRGDTPVESPKSLACSLSSISSQPIPKAVTDAGLARVSVAAVRTEATANTGIPLLPNTPGTVRLVRVASASSNIAEIQTADSTANGLVTVAESEKSNDSLQGKGVVVVTEPGSSVDTPRGKSAVMVSGPGTPAASPLGNAALPVSGPGKPNDLQRDEVQPAPKAPPRGKGKVKPATSEVSVKHGPVTSASPELLTGISNTPTPPVDTNAAISKAGEVEVPDDVKLLDYNDTMAMEEIENNMQIPLGADIVQQKTDPKSLSKENGQSENCLTIDLEGAELEQRGEDSELVEDIGDQELEELFEVKVNNENNSIAAVEVIEVGGVVADDNDITTIELDADGARE